jgi:hypothetical protein
MAKSSSSRSGGIGFLGALTILFIGLKLGDVIDWSWLWVLAPLWGGFALFFIVLVCAGLIIAIGERR